MMFTIRGIPTAGIAVGTAFVLQRRASAAATAAAGDPVAEAGRFHAALERAKAELSALAEGEAVFAAHLEMAGDPMLAGLVEGRIAEKHLSSEQPAIASIAAVKRKIFRMVLFCWLRNIWLVEIRVTGFARVGQTFRTAVAYRL